MSLIKLDLASLSLMEKVQFGYRVGSAMIENEATFPEPPIAGADFQDIAGRLCDAAASAESARALVREFLSAQAGYEAELDAAFMQIARYVQNVTGGNVATIAIAGLTVRNPPSPVGRLPMPLSLTAVPGARGRIGAALESGAPRQQLRDRTNDGRANARILAAHGNVHQSQGVRGRPNERDPVLVPRRRPQRRRAGGVE